MNITPQWTQTDHGIKLINQDVIYDSLIQLCVSSHDLYNICLETFKAICNNADIIKYKFIENVNNIQTTTAINNIPTTTINNINYVDDHAYFYIYVLLMLILFIFYSIEIYITYYK